MALPTPTTSTLPLLHVIQASFGDSLIINFLDNQDGAKRKYWFIDGGPGNVHRSATTKTTNNSVFSTINDEKIGIDRLERVIITHNDKDHTYGAYSVISSLQDKSASTTAKAAYQRYLKFVSWAKGYQAMQVANGPFPIGHIWFNDAPNVATSIGSSPAPVGWMNTLLDAFRTTNPNSIPIPALNDDWSGVPGPVVRSGTAKTFNSIASIIGPTARILQLLHQSGMLSSEPNVKASSAVEFLKDSREEPSFPADVVKWARMEDTAKKGDDDTETNYSSIAFEFNHNGTGKRFMMTGDANGSFLFQGLGGTIGTPLATYDIIKLPHHGSCNNCVLNAPVPGKPNKVLNEVVGVLVKRFFKHFRATKYVISADTLNSSPNPDLNTIQYMGAEFAAEAASGTPHPVTAVYITNGVTYKSWRWFHYGDSISTTKINGTIAMKVLKDRDSVDYGTVVPSTVVAEIGVLETNWITLESESDWASYFIIQMGQYFENWLKEVSGKPEAKAIAILPKLLTLTTDSASTASSVVQGSLNRAKFSGPPVVGERSSKRIKKMTEEKTKKKGLKTNQLFVRPMNVLASSPAIKSTVTAGFHDVIIANLIGNTDLATQYGHDISLPTVIPAAQVLADGVTPSWVDLATYISLMESSNSQFVPTKLQPRLDISYFQAMKWWFLSADGKKPETTILASMLLGALLNESAAELFICLPLNMNGAAAFGRDPFAAFKAGAKPPTSLPTNAMMNLVLQNFAAEVVVPTAAQYAAGQKLEAISYYFELNPPPSSLNNLAASDVWTWTLPFTNDLWKAGQVVFTHKGPLKVKMMFPLYEDAFTFCSFDSNLKISRASPVTLPVHGTMYATLGQPASYDIQFVGDANGQVKALDILNIFSPSAAFATTLFSNMAASFEIPGINLVNIVNNDMVLQDAGLILRQHQQNLTSTSINDIYGTVSTGTILKLASDLLPFPTGLQIPQNLPNLTLTVSNITGDQSNRASLAFSQVVSGLGTIALQVARGSDKQTSFDIFAISEPGISVGDMLTNLSNEALLPSFEAARLFTDMLAGLFVPYVHLSFGPTTPYKSGSSYGLNTLTLTVELDTDINIPSDNPMITLEDVSFEILYSGASEGVASDMSVYGTANMVLGGFDALCTFQVDHSEDEIEAFLADDFTVPTGPVPTDSTGGFEGTIYLSLSFPNAKPSIGAIIDGFLKDADASGLNSLSKNIPPQLLSILDSVDFEVLEMQIQKDSTTNNKWQINFFHLRVALYGLENILNILPGVTFGLPVLDVFIHAPGDPINKAYEISLGTIFGLNGGIVNLSANFDSPPPGYLRVPGQCITLSMQPDFGHPGLPLGAVVSTYVGKALNALDVNVQDLVPTEVQSLVDSVTLDQAFIAFLNTGTTTSSKWQTKIVEVMISAAGNPLPPFENFSISGVGLHFVWDSGLSVDPKMVVPAKTSVQFNSTLTIGSTNPMIVNAAFTYESSTKSFTFTLKSTQTIHLVDLILDAIDDIGLEIPDSIANSIEKILVIDINSFYISYSPGSPTLPKQISFSNDGLISLFGVSVSNISVFCSEPPGGSWAYTVSLSLPTPCYPLQEFSGIPFLNSIRIDNGKFAFFKGKPSPQVVGQAMVPATTGSSVILSGQLKLGGTPFMDLIHSIVMLDEIDIAILPGIVTIALPAASLGLNIMDIFKVKSFNLAIYVDGLGLGATVELDAKWLSTTPILATFLLIADEDSAFGASIEIDNITNPFGLPGISLINASFSLVWLAEAFEPQSLSATASILVTEPGADPISGGFALSMDEVNPQLDYFRLNIEHLTLVNLINTMTNGECPSALKAADIGFQKLVVDFEIGSLTFTLDGDFILFALEGKVAASVTISTGISFAANTNIVDILGLVKIHAYKTDAYGPFVYLDTTVKDISSGNFGPPKWLGVTTKDDPNLKGAMFALSATLIFLGAELDIYGVVSTSGLQLIVASSNGLDTSNISFHVRDTFSITINDVHFVAGSTFHFDLSLHIPSINVGGIELGAIDGTVVTLDDELSLTVNYAEADWHNDGIIFYVWVRADVLGLTLNDQLQLDVTITSLEQLPDAIEKFVEDKVIDYLKDKIAGPIIQIGKDIYKAANDAIAALRDGFNILGSDIVNLLTDAGHEIEAIADGLKNTLNYTIDEVASALYDFGHDVNEIGTIIGNVFEAGSQEVLSALSSAGVTIEHAVDAVFDEAGAELSKDFNLVGNSIAGFALDAEKTVEHFLTGDVKDFVENTLSDAGNFFEGVGSDIKDFFTGGDCVTM